MKSKKMKVIVFPSDQSGCGWYRCLLPAAVIQTEKLLDIEVSFNPTHEVMQRADICVWQRQYKPNLLTLAKEYAHKKHIFELDDNLLNIAPDNPSYKAYQNKEIKENLYKFIQFCDHVTCSTEPLKEVLSRYNKNVTVVTNSILPEFKRIPEINNSSIRIGWQGSAHHYNDLKFITNALVEVCKKYSNVKIVWMGWLPEYIKNSIPANRLEVHGWVDFQNYYDKLRSLNIDIGLAPLEDNIFNKSKSALRYYENSLMGACTVASNVYPYTHAIKSGTDGLIVQKNRHKDWFKAIKSLIDNKELRHSMTINAQTKVLAKHDLYKNINQWTDVYKVVAEKEKISKRTSFQPVKNEKLVCNETIPIVVGKHPPIIKDVLHQLRISKPIEGATIQRILAVKLDHIGDFILSLPALNLLRKKYPKAHITLLTANWNKCIADKLDIIDNVITFDFFNQVSEKGINSLTEDKIKELQDKLSVRPYDLAIDLRRHPETREVLKLARATYTVGYEATNCEWLSIMMKAPNEHGVPYVPHITAQICQLVNTLKKSKSYAIAFPQIDIDTDNGDYDHLEPYDDFFNHETVIGINPGVGTMVRQWPTKYYSELIDKFIEEDDAHIALFGAPSEEELAKEVYDNIKNKDNVLFLVGKASLDDFLLLVKYCHLFIGNNSGSGHLAGMVNTPTLIAFSGQVLSSQWSPLGNASFTVRAPLNCAPCYFGFKEQCHRDIECLKAITPELLYKVGKSILTSDRKTLSAIVKNIK